MKTFHVDGDVFIDPTQASTACSEEPLALISTPSTIAKKEPSRDKPASISRIRPFVLPSDTDVGSDHVPD